MKKLNTYQKMGRIDFFYNLPDIIYGLPLYDKNACLCYIIYKLRTAGFQTEYIYPSGIHINWSKDKKDTSLLLK